MLVYLAYFVIFSFIGWVLDTAYRSWNAGKYAPRTLIPYFSTIYGFGVLILLAIFQQANLTFLEHALLGGIAITLLEFMGGTIGSRILEEKLWDYSDSKYHLYGHIDAMHTLFWFVLSTILRAVFPYLPGI